MIKANNIAELFDFIKKNRKSNTLNLKISKKGIIKTNLKSVSDITVKNNSILFHLKIDPILRQCCEILLPLIRKKDRVFIGQIGQSLDAKIALNNIVGFGKLGGDDTLDLRDSLLFGSEDYLDIPIKLIGNSNIESKFFDFGLVNDEYVFSIFPSLLIKIL